MRKRVSLTLLAVVGSVSIAIGLSEILSRSAPGTPTITLNKTQHPILVNSFVDPPRTIDGAKNPDRISDQVAYSLLFRFLSERQTEVEKSRARSYLKKVFGCKDCITETQEQRTVMQARIDAFVAVVRDFERRIGVLDRQAKEIKARNRANFSPNAVAQLAKLQQKKESIVAEIIASLPKRLGPDNAEKMRKYVNEDLKRKVKIFPAHDAGR